MSSAAKKEFARIRHVLRRKHRSAIQSLPPADAIAHVDRYLRTLFSPKDPQ